MDRRPIAMLVAIFGALGFTCNQSRIENAWVDLLSQCVGGDLFRVGDAFYFGPSNTLGPGTVWDLNGNHFRLLWKGQQITGQSEDLIHRGETANCIGRVSSSWDVKPSVALSLKNYPVSGELAAALDRGRVVSASISAWRTDYLVEGPFRSLVQSFPLAEPRRVDVERTSSRIVLAAIWVEGFTTSVQYESSLATRLKSEFDIGSGDDSLSLASVDADLSVNWVSEDTLQLTAAKPFYIAGLLGQYSAGGAAGIGDPSVFLRDVPPKSYELDWRQ